MSGYAIKIGTVGGRFVSRAEDCAPNEVYYSGPWAVEADGFRAAMVWDAAINNVRPRSAAEALAAAKTARIEADRQECRRRLTEQYGDALEQTSRASGLYGSTAQANHADGVTACIAASNTARDQINAAQSVAAVEAVVVAWPVLT